MGEAHTPHFYDVGICEPVVKPQNQLCFYGDTRVHQQIKKNPWNVF